MQKSFVTTHGISEGGKSLGRGDRSEHGWYKAFDSSLLCSSCKWNLVDSRSNGQDGDDDFLAFKSFYHVFNGALQIDQLDCDTSGFEVLDLWLIGGRGSHKSGDMLQSFKVSDVLCACIDELATHDCMLRSEELVDNVSASCPGCTQDCDVHIDNGREK